MKPFFLLLVLSASLFGAPADELARLKRDFPGHVVGAVTERSDPEIQECFNRYREAVERLTPESISRDLVVLRKQIDREIENGELALRRRTGNSLSRHALTQNLSWLRQKLIPYLHRLEGFQRGR